MTPRPKLKIRRNPDVATPIKTETLHKTSLNWSNFSSTSKPTTIRTIKLDDNYPEIKLSPNAVLSPRTRKIAGSELILIRTPSLKNNNSPVSQKSLLKIPISELYRKAEVKIDRVNTEYSQKKYSPSQRNEVDLKKKPSVCLNLPSDEYEENLNDSGVKQKNKGITLCSTMESSQTGKTKISSLTNLSASPQNKKSSSNAHTFKELAVHTTLSTPKGDSTKSFKRNGRYKSGGGEKNMLSGNSGNSGACTGTAKNKNSKAVNRFTDAVEKAKVYDDGVILQYQFDKQNEEEEHDFLELYELLNNNIKE